MTDVLEYLDGDEDAEEAEQRSNNVPSVLSGSAVRPIRDVTDNYVFRFEVGPAILAQLLEKLTTIPQTDLSASLGGKYPGFYQLFHKGVPVYIGKTARPIGDRLKEHAKKLTGRVGIEIKDMTCRYAFVEDPSLVDVAEGALISFFGERGMADWNTTGFGSKVTGHGRGGQRSSKWADDYPPQLNLPIEAGSSSRITLQQLVSQLSNKAPVTLSIPTKFRALFKADHSASISIPLRSLPFTEWMQELENLLASGWKIDRTAMSWYITKE